MKKIFAFAAAGLMVLGVASCDPGTLESILKAIDETVNLSGTALNQQWIDEGEDHYLLDLTAPAWTQLGERVLEDSPEAGFGYDKADFITTYGEGPYSWAGGVSEDNPNIGFYIGPTFEYETVGWKVAGDKLYFLSLEPYNEGAATLEDTFKDGNEMDYLAGFFYKPKSPARLHNIKEDEACHLFLRHCERDMLGRYGYDKFYRSWAVFPCASAIYSSTLTRMSFGKDGYIRVDADLSEDLVGKKIDLSCPASEWKSRYGDSNFSFLIEARSENPGEQPLFSFRYENGEVSCSDDSYMKKFDKKSIATVEYDEDSGAHNLDITFFADLRGTEAEEYYGATMEIMTLKYQGTPECIIY